MRSIVIGLVSMQLGFCLLSIMLTLILTSLFVADSASAPTEDPMASMMAALELSEAQDVTEAPTEAPTEPPVTEPPEPPKEVDIRPYQKAATFLVFLLYTVSIYQLGWQYGLRDRNVVKLGYAKRNTRRGLIAGLIALIPSAILLALALTLEPMQPWFKLTHYMYEWLFQWTNYNAAAYLLVLPMVPVAMQWGFHNGFVDISLRRLLVYRSDKKKGKG